MESEKEFYQIEVNGEQLKIYKNGEIIKEINKFEDLEKEISEMNINGEVKIYTNGKLEFEGEYLNGKKSGKGKEYDEDGDLMYEGEYLNGERNGKGQEYCSFGQLKFEGEYLNGKKSGKGKEYYPFGQLEFEGEYLNGERNGKGTEYWNEKLTFEGEYFNGKRHGKGKEYNSKGKLIFEGTYLNGVKWTGERKEYYNNGILEFEGEYLEGEINGEVQEYWPNGALAFRGKYKNDKKHGQGEAYDEDRELRFKGEYNNGIRWKGKGKEFYENGRIKFEGEYKNGKKKGKLYYNRVDEYGRPLLWFDGEISNDWPYTGKVIEYHPNGKVAFVGEIKNGMANGEAFEFNDKGILIFMGEYLNDEKHGKVKEYGHNGDLIFKGEYKNGEKHGKAKEYAYYPNSLFVRILIFEGEYKNGIRWKGKGKEYWPNGKIKFYGEYLNGKWHGQGRMYYESGALFFEGEFKDDAKYKGKQYYDDLFTKKLMFEGEFQNYEFYNGTLIDENGKVKHQGFFLDKKEDEKRKQEQDFLKKNTFTCCFDKAKENINEEISIANDIIHIPFKPKGLTNECVDKKSTKQNNPQDRIIYNYYLKKIDKRTIYNNLLNKINKATKEKKQLIISIGGESTMVDQVGIFGTFLTSKFLDDIIQIAVNNKVKIIRIDNITCYGVDMFKKVDKEKSEYAYTPEMCEDIAKGDKNYLRRQYLHDLVIEYAKKYPQIAFYYGYVSPEEGGMSAVTRVVKIITFKKSNGKYEVFEKKMPAEQKKLALSKTDFDTRQHVEKEEDRNVILYGKYGHIITLKDYDKYQSKEPMTDKKTNKIIEDTIKDAKNNNKNIITISIDTGYKVKKSQFDKIFEELKKNNIENVKINNHNTKPLELYDDKQEKVICDINEYMEEVFADSIKNKKDTEVAPNFKVYYGQFRKNDKIISDKNDSNYNYDKIPFYKKFYVRKDDVEELSGDTSIDVFKSKEKIFRLISEGIEISLNLPCLTKNVCTPNQECYEILRKDIDIEIDKIKGVVDKILKQKIDDKKKEEIKTKIKLLDQSQSISEMKKTIDELNKIVEQVKQPMEMDNINLNIINTEQDKEINNDNSINLDNQKQNKGHNK